MHLYFSYLMLFISMPYWYYRKYGRWRTLTRASMPDARGRA